MRVYIYIYIIPLYNYTIHYIYICIYMLIDVGPEVVDPRHGLCEAARVL